jgi:hypothetical protein
LGKWVTLFYIGNAMSANKAEAGYKKQETGYKMLDTDTGFKTQSTKYKIHDPRWWMLVVAYSLLITVHHSLNVGRFWSWQCLTIYDNLKF